MTYRIPEENLTTLRQMHEEGRIIKGDWQATDEDGRRLACLLGALSPDIRSPKDCPAQFMPDWLAHLTPSIDDEVSDAVWHSVIDRYVAVAGKWSILSDDSWERVKWRFIDRCLEITEPHDGAGVVSPVRALIERQLSGDPPSNRDWVEAERDARAAARGAATAAEAAAARATAAWAATAARAAAAAAAVRAGVWDDLADHLLSLIEAEIEAAEAAMKGEK